MNRQFEANDVGHVFVCVDASGQEEHLLLPDEKLVEGRRYTLRMVHFGKGIFEEIPAFGDLTTFTSDRFEHAPGCYPFVDAPPETCSQCGSPVEGHHGMCDVGSET